MRSRSRDEESGLIVLIPGFQDTAALWDAVILRLNVPGWRIRALDLRHVDDVALAYRGSTLEGYRDQVIDGIGHTGRGERRPIVVVGHSMGAQVAELVAVALPDSTTGLVLISPIPLAGYPVDEEQAEGFAKVAGHRDISTIAAARKELLVNDTTEVLRALVSATLSTPTATALQALDAWPAGHPLGDATSRVRAPVLLVDSDDRLSTRELIRDAIAPRFVDVRVAHVPGAGHWPHVEQPAAVAEILTDFVAGPVSRMATAMPHPQPIREAEK